MGNPQRWLKILSLFDWISCWYEAFIRAWFRIEKYFASEIDQYAIKIAMKNHPDIIQIWDVTKIKGDDYKNIDIIIWWSPCQWFSVAWKQLAFDDPRSKLFFEYVRLLKEIKPKYFLLENVKMKKEYQDIISQYLGVEPIEINSSLVSAQVRKRLYRTNIEWIKQPIEKWIFLKDILEKDVDLNIHVVWNQYNHRIFTDKCWTLWTWMWRTAKQGIWIYKWNICPENYIRKLTPVECERLQTLPDNYTEWISNTQRYKTIWNGWTVDVLSHIFKNIQI